MKQPFYILMAVLPMGCADGSRKHGTLILPPHPIDSVMQANGYDVVPLFKTRDKPRHRNPSGEQ